VPAIEPKSNDCPECGGQLRNDYEHREVVCINCVPPDTLLVSNPGLIEISANPTTVMTDQGELRSVTERFMHRHSGKIVEIRTWHCNLPVRVTCEHPILTLMNGQLRWSPASSLKPGDLLAVAKPTRIIDVKRLSISTTIGGVQSDGILANKPFMKVKSDARNRYSNTVSLATFYEIHRHMVNGIGLRKIAMSLGLDSGTIKHRFFPNLKWCNPQEAKKPKPTTSYLRHCVPDVVTVNRQFLRLAGYYLAEGWSRGNNGLITFSFNRNETSYAKDVARLMKIKFNLPMTIETNKNCCTVLACSKPVAQFLCKLFGDTSTEKHIPMSFLYLPPSEQLELLNGLWRGDGCLIENKYVVFTTCSKALATATYLILLRLGMLPTLKRSKPIPGVIEGRAIIGRAMKFDVKITARKDVGRLLNAFKMPAPEPAKHKQPTRGLVTKNYTFFPIKAVTERQYDGQVCNLEVEADNNYALPNAILHNCGLVVQEMVNMRTDDQFPDRTGHGMTLPHLPDKNLATTFRPEEVRDEGARLQFRRLHGINRRIPQRKDGWAYYRRAQDLRPFLERVYPPFDIKAERQDKISKVLEFASRLTSKRSLPHSLPRLKEALAAFCIVHTDPNILLRQEGERARFVGLEGLIDKILATETRRDANEILSSRGLENGLRTTTELPANFTLKTKNGRCAWQTSIRFGLNKANEANEEVEFLATLAVNDQSFNIGIPITICRNVVGRGQSVTEHRRLDEFTIAFLMVSKQKCRVGDSVKLSLSLQPPPANKKPIQGTLNLRTERTRTTVMETYERLSLHYGLPVSALTPNAIIENDVKLTPHDKRRALQLAKEVDEAFRSRVTVQRLEPEVVAAIAVVDGTGQSVIDVAYRYRLDPGNLRSKLATWRTQQELRPVRNEVEQNLETATF